MLRLLPPLVFALFIATSCASHPRTTAPAQAEGTIQGTPGGLPHRAEAEQPHAVVDARQPPSAWEQAREQMVTQQIASPADGRQPVTNPRVLEALLHVERHRFVPAAWRDRAYADSPLPIGHDQTISQPYIVAVMTELLDPQAGDVVLEVGTGSGYQAAVLAELVGRLYTIEIVEPLARRAARDLEAAGYTNVEVRAGDGYRGWPEHAPFDSIIVTAAPDHIPAPLIEQLKVGGRLVIPVGTQGWLGQNLEVLEKQASGDTKKTAVMPVRFVPLTRSDEATNRPVSP